jgi:uncharacterized protein (TIGR03435 family)
MKRLLIGLGIAALLSGSALGQSPATRPAFDIAGIQASTRPNPGMRGGVLRGNRYELRNATMVDLIRTAYGVVPDKITGGPSWIEWNRFDIAALAPEGTPPDRLREMLKTLLAERFKLAVREDMTTTTGMALKVAGTHKLRGAAGAGGCQGQGAPEPNGVPAQTVTCKGQTMAQLAEQLPRMAGAYFPGGQQVVDETGLSGEWDFELKWTPRAMLAQAGSDGMTIQSAIEKLGLKLEPKEMKVPAIVVDTVTAEFAPNSPDVARRLPPLPDPQFEVAVVKPSPPEAQQPRAQLLPNGQVNASAAPLNLMIALAWDLPNPTYLVGPKWLETTRFDVTARAFATTNPDNQAQLDEDRIRLMLRSLIVERFQMKFHMEDRPMPAYNLRADGPKMTKSDPTKRTRCFEGAPPGSAAAAKPQPFTRQVTCQNVSMDQFGQLLPSIAGGYTRARAIDMTGLEGGYDFTINFSTIGQVQGPAPDAANPGTGIPVDPTGALPLPDAARRQLGIRLEEVKRLLPVMVVDSISEKPLDN